MTFIDETAKRTASIVRKNATAQDSLGQFVASETTIQSGIICDIQTIAQNKDNVMRSETGEETDIDHVMFTATYITSPFKIMDIVIDESSAEEFEIVGKQDWRDHWEIYLNARDRTNA